MAFTPSTFTYDRGAVGGFVTTSTPASHVYYSSDGDDIFSILSPGYFSSNFGLPPGYVKQNDLLKIIGIDGTADIIISDPSVPTFSLINSTISTMNCEALNVSNIQNEIAFNDVANVNLDGGTISYIDASDLQVGKTVSDNVPFTGAFSTSTNVVVYRLKNLVCVRLANLFFPAPNNDVLIGTLPSIAFCPTQTTVGVFPATESDNLPINISISILTNVLTIAKHISPNISPVPFVGDGLQLGWDTIFFSYYVDF